MEAIDLIIEGSCTTRSDLLAAFLVCTDGPQCCLFPPSIFSLPQNRQITEIYKYSAQQSSHPCLSVSNVARFLLAVEVETIFKTVKIF